MSSTASSDFAPLTGHCICKTLTYTVTVAPLITHCCHCTYCQQETGSAFALNTVIETYNFTLTSSTSPLIAQRPSPSAPDGSQHWVAYCPNPNCNTDVFAYYGANKATIYLKVGTLDAQSRSRVRPDVHIFTSTKVEWVDLTREVERGAKVFEGFYDNRTVWSAESLRRLEALRAWKVRQEEAGGSA
ncbi:Mss4-like protein [Boeremia exigua]|uniref:Mss4-like protein n=1 Tax=Boeremia exigua TaxID=749465 RepID=UPI001E8D0F44|nr:Mss4-like protein [Boeremia exigua]KAH6620486.1 Mss4-like protein [Boeremia exigua]